MTADETSVDEAAEISHTAQVEETADFDSAGSSDEDRNAPGLSTRLIAVLAKRPSAKRLAALLVVLVVASLALVGSLMHFYYLPDHRADAAAAKAAVSAASDGTVAVLSYSPDTLDRDFSSAKSHLTGDFLSYYDQFTQQIIVPAAKEKSLKTTAVVLRGAVSTMRPDSATVLLFVNQTTQSKDRPEPTVASSSVSVTLTKANGKWLISSFKPV